MRTENAWLKPLRNIESTWDKKWDHGILILIIIALYPKNDYSHIQNKIINTDYKNKKKPQFRNCGAGKGPLEPFGYFRRVVQLISGLQTSWHLFSIVARHPERNDKICNTISKRILQVKFYFQDFNNDIFGAEQLREGAYNISAFQHCVDINFLSTVKLFQ